MIVEPAKIFAPAVDQLFSGEHRSGGVIRADIIHAGDVGLAVDADHRNMLLHALIHQRFGWLAGGDYYAGDAKLSEMTQRFRQLLLRADLRDQSLKAVTLNFTEQAVEQAAAKKDRGCARR
ncbi:Uncharacterised protein [Cedecea neteri]|uniref:Uncharacterized protein n=1 Tax=Cedecea neteri TaxID=158822 RepID=A0A2X3JCI2_9ENTR|nr:Uncharacterised protein [Cedecea neteri]